MDTKYKMLRIYVGESSKYKRKNLYHFIVEKLKEVELEGVTVTRAIVGYGKSKKIHTVNILDLSADLPIIIEAIDTEEKILKALHVIKDFVKDGKIITMDVNVVKQYL